jgi:histidine triad (HIT) family protein
MATIFSKIINKQIPSYNIFENDLLLCFLDINPISKGHTLIIPKVEYDYFVDVPEPYYSEVFKLAKIISKAIEKSFTCQRVALLVEGSEIPHFHLHLIPIYKNTSFDLRDRVKFNSEQMQNIQQLLISEVDLLTKAS